MDELLCHLHISGIGYHNMPEYNEFLGYVDDLKLLFPGRNMLRTFRRWSQYVNNLEIYLVLMSRNQCLSDLAEKYKL